MEIEFSAKNKPQEWLKTIASQFRTNIIDNTFKVPTSVGECIFKQFYFFEGLPLTYFHIKLVTPLEFIRYSIPEAKLIPMIIFV